VFVVIREGCIIERDFFFASLQQWVWQLGRLLQLIIALRVQQTFSKGLHQGYIVVFEFPYP
jgi:hypothetical protein